MALMTFQWLPTDCRGRFAAVGALRRIMISPRDKLAQPAETYASDVFNYFGTRTYPHLA